MSSLVYLQVKTESRTILVDCTLGSRYGSCNDYFMPPPEHLILTHWPLDPSKQFVQSPLLLEELQQIIPVPITIRCLGLHPFNWSEIIRVSKASPDPVPSVSFGLTDTTASYVTAQLVPQSCSQEAGGQDNHTFVTKVNPNEFNVQAVLPTSGNFILNIYLKEIKGNQSNHLCLSYIIESEIHHEARVGYPYIYSLSARAFDFIPKYWNTGNKSYNCVNSNSAQFSLVFEASPDVSFYHCLIRGRTTGPNESNPSDVYHHQTVLVNNKKSLYKLLAIFPDEHWWTIYISGTRTIKGTTSGYTSLLTYHVFAEKGSRKLSYPQTLVPGTVLFSSIPIAATHDKLTTVPFATSEHLTFYHYLTLGELGSEIHEGYSNIELDQEHTYNNQGCIHYLLNVVFPKGGTWFVHVYNTQSNGVNEGLFKLRITIDNPKSNTHLIQSNALLLKKFGISLLNNSIVTFTDDGEPFSFEFTAGSDIDLLHELKMPDNSPVDYCTYLTRQRNTHQLSYTLSAIFPTPGKWTVELFASKAGNNSYELVLNLKLDVKSPIPDHCYPKIYPAFSDYGCQLLNNPLLKSSCDSGEFKLPFRVSSAAYFFFKLENEGFEDFSQQAFVHTSPDSQDKLLHLIFPECGRWKLSMYANQLQQPAEQAGAADQLLQISVQSNACIHDASFPILYKQFYEPFRLYFNPKDLPLPSIIKSSKHPQRFSISYYSPPDVIFLHYAELRMQDTKQSVEDLETGGEATERVQTRMVSNSSTGLHHLQVEVAKTGHWTILLYASSTSTDVLESPEKWIPVMKYVFSAI